ncbi:MFS transporter [Arthrobacter sp. ov118]|uniref:MFS transporter n=1 Tax=Arthrobacter sp. ov118 TaxID=1761747 RepID=UPI0008F43245|nr:MFS transporter [Arthrobacter sp. ov118]SFU10405.1 MFS transporter, ACS family, tartrate transporter [Arthrobacter sp. ov118]
MTDTTHPPQVDPRTIKIIKWRLLPFLMILYIAAFIDRANIGFTAKHLEADLGITPAVFGLLSGAFFIGYFIFEVPSNLLLQKFGARKWITRIVASWGLVAAATAFVDSGQTLLIVRILLGIAEAGFFPGIILFLTYWFPEKERARTVAMFMVALPVATVIAGPVSGLILDNIHWLNWESWRWMFLIEGAFALVLAPFALKLLVDSPAKAKWLTQGQKDELQARLEFERAQKVASHGSFSKWKVLVNPRVLAMAVIYFAKSNGIYALVFFTPSIMASISKSTSATTVGLLTALPYVLATVAMIYWARRSDKTGERRYHVAIPYLIGAAALVVLGFFHTDMVISTALICLITVCMYVPYGPFWSLPSMFLTGAAAASGLAWINALANLGGFFGPTALGAANEATGSVYVGLFFVAGLLVIAAITVLRLKVVTPIDNPEPEESRTAKTAIS